MTDATFLHYFDDKSILAEIYGFKGSFKIIHQALVGSHLTCVLQKSKKTKRDETSHTY